MLVSSIGYFNPLNNMVHRDYVVNNQSSKINLNEGFGHTHDLPTVDGRSMFSRFVDSCSGFFNKDKNDESGKYLSLIG